MRADVTLEKALPNNLDAERAILGAILLENSLIDQAVETLTMEDFYHEGHRKIFDVMSSLSADARPIDSVTLCEELQRKKILDEVGGIAYVGELFDGTPKLSNIEDYARIVKEKALLRRLIHSANEILLRSYSNEEEPAVVIDAAEKAVFEIGQERIQSGFVGLNKLLGETYKHIETLYQRKELVSGISTGFKDIDSMTSGFQPSDLIVLAARPGLGKTSFALNVAQHASVREDKTVGIFSLEMSSQQLVTRLLCAEARVDSQKVRSGYLSKEDWARLAKAMNRLAQAKIYIDDSPGISVVEMRAKVRRLVSQAGLDFLIIDYLQLMSGGQAGPGRARHENRQQEISAISRSLKGLAKEIAVPILSLSQLSRAPEQRRGDHRPQLSDLRESGAIEQDADVVIFIYRPDIYKKEEDFDEEDGIAELIIGKQRNGPTGTVKLAFIEQWTKFENLARDME